MADFLTDNDDITGPMELYGSNKLILINCGNTNDDFCDELEDYCEANNYEWNYSDSVAEDFEMDIAYLADVCGNYFDVIMSDCGWLGRAGFEDGTYDWDTISDCFINNDSKALPKWFPTTQLESAGYKLQSCEFADGWYEQADDPSIILAKANGKGYDVVFQINYAQPFEVGFCVWLYSSEEDTL